MTRVEFKLSMPGRASWNKGWSGEGKNYAVVRELTDEQTFQIFESNAVRFWTHGWSDGWVAEVSARVVSPGEELKKSDGFNGYEWMIDNILKTGSPYSEVTS